MQSWLLGALDTVLKAAFGVFLFSLAVSIVGDKVEAVKLKVLREEHSVRATEESAKAQVRAEERRAWEKIVRDGVEGAKHFYQAVRELNKTQIM